MTRRLAAELALRRHNKLNRQGVVDADAQSFHVLNDILPAPVITGLMESLDGLPVVRSETSWRTGSAIGGHELSNSPLATHLKYLSTETFLNDVRQRAGIPELQWVPEADTNRLSLLRYAGSGSGSQGDHIDWHVDGSIYLGERWAGILTLLECCGEESAKLELMPDGELVTLPAATAPNSLVLFRGDHVRHRVRPMLPGEERVVLSLLFSTWPVRTLNPSLRRYQSRVNKTFYGDPSP